MKVNPCLTVLLLALAASVSAAGLEDLSSLAVLSAAAPVPEAAAPAPLRDWTVMYFVNGKNNLESSALMDVNQMELAGSSGKGQ